MINIFYCEMVYAVDTELLYGKDRHLLQKLISWNHTAVK